MLSGFEASDDGRDVPGLDANIPVTSYKVIHFHQFDLDAHVPEGLEYLVYGDQGDILINHLINPPFVVAEETGTWCL
jgi:hypothetical protein